MSEEKVPGLHKVGPNPWDYEFNPAVGQKITFVDVDGEEFTDAISDVRYESGSPAIWPHRSWWQEMVRRLTPRRFRKPLQPTRSASLPTVTIRTEARRHADLIAGIADTVARLTAEPVKVPWWRRWIEGLKR